MKTVILAIGLVLGLSVSALAQTAPRELKAVVVQIEQSEKEAMVMIDSPEQVLLIKNLTKFTAGELSLLKSSLEQSTPIKIKAQGNEIIAISSK